MERMINESPESDIRNPSPEIFFDERCDIFENLVLISKEMAEINDEILIEGIKTQNEKVIAEIYTQFFPSVRHYIYRNNGSTDDAREIFSDAIVVVLMKARENALDLKCSLKTYIYAISRNLWLKKIGSERVDIIRYDEIQDTLAGADLIEEAFFDVSRARLLFQKHLVRMSPTCRKLIEYFLEGKSFREITGLMHYENESYARKRKYRCIKILVRRIKSDPDYNTIYDDDH
jgi:RNA polymerase sigma factor (sigma-70 family)